MKVTLQNMFPSINVATVKLQDCRRVVMFNLDKTKGTVEMRHFAVRATPTGIAKAIKKVHTDRVSFVARTIRERLLVPFSWMFTPSTLKSQRLHRQYQVPVL